MTINREDVLKVIPDKRYTKVSDKKDALESMAMISESFFLSAETLYEKIVLEGDQTNKWDMHDHAFGAILLYAQALDAFLNEIIGFHVCLHERCDEEGVRKAHEVVAKGLYNKQEAFYNFFELEASDFKAHKAIKKIANLRNELTHYFPYMLNENICRDRVSEAIEAAGLTYIPNIAWTGNLARIELLAWVRKSCLQYIIELSRKIKMPAHNHPLYWVCYHAKI